VHSYECLRCHLPSDCAIVMVSIQSGLLRQARPAEGRNRIAAAARPTYKQDMIHPVHTGRNTLTSFMFCVPS
jgi:hypothetical protein